MTHRKKGIRFNTRDSFFAKLDLDANPGCGTGRLSDVTDGSGKGALPFIYFLVVELVRIDAQHVEERYIPTSGIGENNTEYEEIMNAFVHYAYQVSHRRFIFADLQGVYYKLELLFQLIRYSFARCQTTRGWLYLDRPPVPHRNTSTTQQKPRELGLRRGRSQKIRYRA